VEKSPDAFRTISEVAQELDVPQHVLRFWESRFHEIRPMKRGGGRRYYRPDDVDLLRGIRHLLYGEGYTIRGVQRLLREQGLRFVQNVWQPGAPQPGQRPSRDVSDESEGADEAPRGHGLPGLLPSLRGVAEEERPDAASAPHRSAPRTPPPGGGRLQREHVMKLRAALEELSECRRLLDSALVEKS
jgi:DNA-binding transcriptional MerR regulator